jgi:hypothetical protein
MPRRWSAAVILALLPAAAPAQVRYPAPPEKYDAHLRYRIQAGRDERIRQFREMTVHLEKFGFVPAEREDADLDIFDPIAERTHGTVPSATALKLLDDPRVLAVVLVPAGTAVPDDPQKLLQVRITLPGGLAPTEQKQLHDQTAALLGRLGFREGVAYDSVGFTRLRGTLPAGSLFTLLKDVRYQPAGWFAPAGSPDLLPLPLRAVYPVRVVEVLPELPEATAPPLAPPAAPVSPKITDDLVAYLADPASADKPLRVEVVFDAEPLGGLRDLELTFRAAADGSQIDGLVGLVGSALLPKPADVAKVADLPEVKAVRLPRAGHPTARPVAADAAGVLPVAKVLDDTRLSQLHVAGHKGQGTRVVVVASGFPESAGDLPKGTKFVDLTAELDPGLNPAPPRPDAGGTAVARVVAASAPASEMTLVRIHPDALHQLLTVARAAAGERTPSVAMQARAGEQTRRGLELAGRRTAVIPEYQAAFADLSDEAGPAKRRAAAAAALNQLLADERELKAVRARFAALQQGLDALGGAGVVVNTLVWEDGFPNDGQSELSRYLDTRYVGLPPRTAIRAAQQPATPGWVQADTDQLGSVWAGPFLDADGNGAMAFAPPDGPLPPGTWTRELNFFRLLPVQGDATATLPAGLRVRIGVQWREPHDPDDVYAPDPVYPLQLRVFRQTDPEGKVHPSDELTEVSRSTGPTVRLLRTPMSGVYETSLTFTVPADGVYALRVERVANGDQFLSAKRESADIRPRIVIRPADAASAEKGRVVFGTFAPRTVGVGIPGDSPAAVTVGAAGPDAVVGAGPGVILRAKPDLFAPGGIAVGDAAAAGPGAAAGFVGGAAAVLRSAGVRPADMVRTLGMTEGGPFAVPPGWLSHLGPRVERSER